MLLVVEVYFFYEDNAFARILLSFFVQN